MDKTKLERIENFIVNANNILDNEMDLNRYDGDWRPLLHKFNHLIEVGRWEDINVPDAITELRFFIECDINPEHRYDSCDEFILELVEDAKEAINDMEYDYELKDE